MKILIDCSTLKAGGGIQVALSFIYDLKDLEVVENYIILMSPEFATALDTQGFSNHFSFIPLKSTTSNILKKEKEIKILEENIKPDVIFTVFGPSNHKSKVPKVVGYALPHYIYTKSPFFQIITLKEKLKLRFLKQIRIYAFKRNSNYVIFETHDARDIFCSLYNYPKFKTFVVSNRLNQIFLDERKWRKRNVHSGTEYRILCLAANYKHKNLGIIPAVIDSLKSDFQFDNFKFIISQTKENLNFPAKYDPYIEYLGKIPIEELPHLYKTVNLLFMPTLLEVFSTTYLEAMHMEVPIITSNLSFAKDVCRDGALYFDPLNISNCSEKIIKVLTNENLKEKLIIRGKENLLRFGSSMDRTKKYLEIIKHAKEISY